MIIANFSIEEFLGIMFFFPLFIYLTLVVFDGLGIFRDVFFTSTRKRR
jgi:hypothetical protein